MPNHRPLSLAFQSAKDASPWVCPFHPPLQLFFVIRNTRQLSDFGLAEIKVWNYWTADDVSIWPGGWRCSVVSQQPDSSSGTGGPRRPRSFTWVCQSPPGTQLRLG